MTKFDATVFIVDDDSAVRRSMELLLRSVGQQHRIFNSGREFLDALPEQPAGCAVLDIRMPGIGGLEIQEKLIERGIDLPVIFVSGYGDIPMAVHAMQQGAFDFIEKPFRDQELLDRINDALQKDSSRRAKSLAIDQLVMRTERLTQREREVMQLVVSGKQNKLIAHELNVSQRTIEIHRARVMEKMEARSLADLVRMQLEMDA
jgi:FixJ family two-component response regulator